MSANVTHGNANACYKRLYFAFLLWYNSIFLITNISIYVTFNSLKKLAALWWFTSHKHPPSKNIFENTHVLFTIQHPDVYTQFHLWHHHILTTCCQGAIDAQGSLINFVDVNGLGLILGKNHSILENFLVLRQIVLCGYLFHKGSYKSRAGCRDDIISIKTYLLG